MNNEVQSASPIVLGDSRGFGWQNVQATAYRCIQKNDTCLIPSPADAHIVKIQTSRSPTLLEWNYQAKQSACWGYGTMAFLPIGETTRWAWRDPLESLFVGIPLVAWNQVALEVFGRDGSQVDLVPKFCLHDDTLSQILLMLADEFYAGAPNGPLFADGLALALTAHLLRGHSTQPSEGWKSLSALPRWKLKRVEDYVEAHLDGNIRLADLAAAADVAVSYFPRVFRIATGMAPYQYVLRRRVLRAMEMMANAKLDLREIALATGFSSQSHFTTAFRNLNGVTPNRFRRTRSGTRGSAD